MKIGCCVNMLAVGNDGIGAEWIPYLKEYGYDYVELPLAQIMDLSDEDFHKLLTFLDETGLPCESCNNFFPASVRLTGPKASFEKAEAYIEQAVKRASRLGAKTIVFGSSGAKNVPEGFDRSEAFSQVVSVLKKAGEVCRRYGIIISIEPLNQKESNLILNLSEGASLAKAVNMPEVKLLVDYYHFVMENDTPEILSRVSTYLRHVHFAEPIGRVFPKKVLAEYTEFFHVLKEAEYSGRCSIEAYSDDPIHDLKTGIDSMRETLEAV